MYLPLQDSKLHDNTEDADAVVVCNGHYSEPSLPSIPGMDGFPGRQLHTHNYRANEAFTGMRVCVIGAQASGVDISQEIAVTAQQVGSMMCDGGVIRGRGFEEGGMCMHV